MTVSVATSELTTVPGLALARDGAVMTARLDSSGGNHFGDGGAGARRRGRVRCRLGRTVRLGRRAAFWLTATGAPVPGDEAVRIGLLNEVVDDVDALDAAISQKVAALLADRLVLGSLKRMHTPSH